MTQPYGWHGTHWRDEDFGPATKFTGGPMKSRRRWRQILHKHGRRQGQADVEAQLAEMDAEPTFVCSRCGTVTRESDRAAGTTECMYC